MSSISIIIPVYNSEHTLLNLHARLRQVLSKEPISYEIIFVEDCGQDKSWGVIQSIADEDEHVHGFKLSRNYGQHNALLCGIRAAQGDVIITMDDDLQHPPEELPKLLAKLDEGFDVVYGTPEKESHGLLRGVASRITKWVLQGAMGAETAQQVSAFRIFRTSLRSAFDAYRSPSVNIDVMLTWATTNFCGLRVQHDPRKIGESGYTLRGLIGHALNMMTGFSTLPLQLASFIGFVFAVFGLLILIFVVGRFLMSGVVVPGFAFLASIIAIFSGAQLLAIGIIGEYLARIHSRTIERPAYNVAYITTEPTVK